MCQMELAHDVVAAKRARLGADGLNDADIRQELRAGGVSPAQVELLSGIAGPISLGDEPLAESDSLARMIRNLAAKGFQAYTVDLTRSELGIPVARVLVPGLQPYPSTFVSRRLAVASVGASHNSPYAKGIELF
jgi:ribosomal protein S12 methylthiotransferase accessory factor